MSKLILGATQPSPPKNNKCLWFDQERSLCAYACCVSEERKRSGVWRLPSGLLWRCYMYIRLISAPEAFRCPLETVPACVPVRMIDFSGQALHPHVLVLVPVVCTAVVWLLPCGAFRGFMAALPSKPQLMCMARQLQLLLGTLSPCVSMVFCILSNTWSWI